MIDGGAPGASRGWSAEHLTRESWRSTRDRRGRSPAGRRGCRHVVPDGDGTPGSPQRQEGGEEEGTGKKIFPWQEGVATGHSPQAIAPSPDRRRLSAARCTCTCAPGPGPGSRDRPARRCEWARLPRCLWRSSLKPWRASCPRARDIWLDEVDRLGRGTWATLREVQEKNNWKRVTGNWRNQRTPCFSSPGVNFLSFFFLNWLRAMDEPK